MNDNCVSYRTLKLQIPESPMRAHFVKARVKVHVYPDGSHALFHGPSCIGRYDEKERSEMRKTPPKSARRRACGNVDNAHALPTVPQAEQNQKKRTFDVLPKPDKLIRYRHVRARSCPVCSCPVCSCPVSRSCPVSMIWATYILGLATL